MFYLSPFQWNISMYRKQTEQHKLLYFWSIELIYISITFPQNVMLLEIFIVCRTYNQTNYRNIWFAKVVIILIGTAKLFFFFDVFFEKDPHFNDFELTTCLKVFLKKCCQRRDTGSHCIKYARIRVFSDSYSPV